MPMWTKSVQFKLTWIPLFDNSIRSAKLNWGSQSLYKYIYVHPCFLVQKKRFWKRLNWECLCHKWDYLQAVCDRSARSGLCYRSPWPWRPASTLGSSPRGRWTRMPRWILDSMCTWKLAFYASRFSYRRTGARPLHTDLKAIPSHWEIRNTLGVFRRQEHLLWMGILVIYESSSLR